MNALGLHLERPKLSSFIYDTFLSMFGVRSVAETQLHLFFCSVRKYFNESPRVYSFALFTGISKTRDEARYAYNAQALDFFLRLLLSARPQTGKIGDGPEFFLFPGSLDGTGKSEIEASRGKDVVNRAFSDGAFDLSADHLGMILSRVSRLDKGGKMNVDRLLQLSMQQWFDVQERLAKELKGEEDDDVHYDNVLTLEDFRDLLKGLGQKTQIPKSMANDISRFYRETLLNAEPHADTTGITNKALIHTLRGLSSVLKHAENGNGDVGKNTWVGGGSMSLQVPPMQLPHKYALLKHYWKHYSPTIVRSIAALTETASQRNEFRRADGSKPKKYEFPKPSDCAQSNVLSAQRAKTAFVKQLDALEEAAEGEESRIGPEKLEKAMEAFRNVLCLVHRAEVLSGTPAYETLEVVKE